MTLQQILTTILTTAAPGALAWWLMDNLTFLATLPQRAKPFAAFALAALLCVLAFASSVALGYTPQPVDWRAWAEALTPVVAWAWTCSQGAYWATKGRQ